MPRAKIPRQVQDQVLSECRRRCALCFALNDDMEAKVHGQLAHIDRRPENSKPENLVYLCLEHANLYDTKSKQSKGFTPGELRCYQEDLLTVLKVIHDPRHLRRVVGQEYRKAAAEVAAAELRQRRKKRQNED